MKSRAAILGHPLHPILVAIPIGLWSFAPVCDLIYHAGWGDDSWKKAAFYCLAGGLVGAVPAIITGLIDYGIVTNPKAARIAKFHLYFNLVTTVLIAISVWLRWTEIHLINSLPAADRTAALPAYASPGESPAFHLLPVWISLAAVLLVSISGWLGGELVSTYGISVKGVDEPSSKDRRQPS